jgi:hypothetical protein
MEDHMTRIMDRLITNLEGLAETIAEAKKLTGRPLAEIYFETADGPSSDDGGVRFRLMEETLTDGSLVYNVHVGG